MKKLNLIVLALISSLIATAQYNSFDLLLKKMIKQTVPIIEVKELKNNTKGYVILDTREYEEFKVSHIENARYVGFNDFKIDSIKDISKSTPIVVYCSIGVRSEKIGEKLLAAGYSNVKNCYGSIFEWVNEGNQVVDMNNKVTSKIHVYNKKWGTWVKKGEKVY